MFYLEELKNSYLTLLLTVVVLGFGVYIYIFKRNDKKFNLPPGPRGLPIVGILPFLGNNPHVKLRDYGKKYGGIFGTYLGRNYVIVVTDFEIAKQLLGDNAALDRPPNFFQMIPDGAGFTEHNGEEWVEQRRYSMMAMKNLGLGKSNWEKLVQMEISDQLELIAQSEGKPLDIKLLLSASISNNVVSLLTDERLPMGHPKRKVIDLGVESAQLMHNQSGIVINYPKLFKFLVDLRILKVGDHMKNMMNMNKYIRDEIDKSNKDKEGQNYLKKYLTEIEKNEKQKLGNTFTERNLIGNVQSLIIGGSDTTHISIFWLLLAMASFPKIQEKVHQEIDNVLGRDGSVNWVDRLNFPYSMATIMEGQRWRTIVTLNLLHRTNEDIVINGYDLPKGTDIMTVIWAFHYDPKYWKEPDQFRPERFLSNDEKKVEEREAYIPFSYGKRMCPGKKVAQIELFLYFVSIMQKFQILPESEQKLPNLVGFPGLTLQPERQLLRFIPR